MFVIDAEFRDLIQPLSAIEAQELEAAIAREGRVRDAIIVWPTKEGRIVVDGHNRLAISRKLKLPEPRFVEMQFASRDEALRWIISNQLARRNLTREAFKELLGRRELLEQRKAGAPPKDSQRPTRSEVADAVGVSPRTVERSADYAAGLDKIKEARGRDAAETAKRQGTHAAVEKVGRAARKGVEIPEQMLAQAVGEEPPEPAVEESWASPILALRGEFRAIANAVIACRSKLSLHEQSAPCAAMGEEYDVAIASLQRAHVIIEQVVPVRVCPWCDEQGRRCTRCHSKGWLSELDVSHLSSADSAKVR